MKLLRSYGAFITAMLIFGTVGIVRVGLTMPSAIIAFFRGVVGTAVISLYALISGRRLFVGMKKKDVILFTAAGSAIGINWLFLFEAYNYASIPTVTLCNYMEPTIIILLSPFVFGEKYTAKRLVCAALSVFGMVLVSGVADSGISGPKGMIFALIAAVFYAFAVIINKKASSEDACSKTVIQLIAASVVLFPYILVTGGFSEIEWTMQTLVRLPIICFVHTGIAYILWFSSMARLPGQSVAVLSYIDPVSAIIFSALFMNEKMTAFATVGAVIIIGAALVSEIRFKKENGPADATDT